MSLIHLFKYGLSLPPHIAFAKAAKMVRKNLAGFWRTHGQENETTYSETGPVDIASIGSGLGLGALEQIQANSSFLMDLADKTLSHEFNLLGSGWTNLDRADTAPSLTCTKGNADRAHEIAGLIDPTYRRIDWHKDFRSGYYWPSDQRSEAILYGHEPEVDIKVPWELARLQHLPQLALVNLAKNGNTNDPSPANHYVREFQNQVLDFMSANPPGYGVNWACTMDVAIRAANMVFAFDLFRAQKIEFEPAFVGEFVAAIWAHGTHITDHLEWHDGFRGNHYLADITGLLFVASFLPRGPQTDCWLAFSVQEFIRETKIQFYEDGGNAEASSNYHRLSSEMSVYGTARILGLAEDRQAALREYDAAFWKSHPRLQQHSVRWTEPYGPFLKSHFDLLRRMAQFTSDLTKPDQHIVQIGDTDNGRLFKVSPAVMPGSIDEDHLDHRHLLAAIGGLIGDTDLVKKAGPCHELESKIIQCLMGNQRIVAAPSNSYTPIEPSDDRKGHGTPKACHRLIIDLAPTNAFLDAQAISYPDFGIFIWRSETFFLSVRCGQIGQSGNGGHAHNDQLSFELQINGEDWTADPGSFTYTANPKKRDAYRSHLAHSGPRFDLSEPSRLNLGMFRLEDNAQARCLLFDENEFLGTHNGYKLPVYRHLKLGSETLEITDCLGGWDPSLKEITETKIDNAQDLRKHLGLSVPYSRGYGLAD